MENKKNTGEKRKAWKITAIICGCIAAALLIADIVAGNYLVSFALSRNFVGETDVSPEPEIETEAEKIIQKNIERISSEIEKWLKTTDKETVTITSDDGLKIAGDIFHTNKNSHRWLISLHGYSNTREIMYPSAMVYSERDYNILTPDLRGHGESEGDYVGMGWLDRKDILKWIELIIQRDPQAEIVLYGVSMGGATVMMTSGEKLPANVKAAIEDCGYTSVWDIFSDEVKYLFNIPDFPILYTASAFSGVRAGYRFGEASSLKQIENAQIPMLFIHGSKDNFVNVDMVYKLYDSYPAQKKLYIAEGAGHGMSYYLDPARYGEEVVRFLQTVGVE